MTDSNEPGPIGLAAFGEHFARWAPLVGTPAVLIKTWSDTPTSFCVLYRWGTMSSTFGYRTEWTPGDFDSPIEWGEEMAEEVSEPLGTVADRLIEDDAGVLWWGAVRMGIPDVPPLEP